MSGHHCFRLYQVLASGMRARLSKYVFLWYARLNCIFSRGLALRVGRPGTSPSRKDDL